MPLGGRYRPSSHQNRDFTMSATKDFWTNDKNCEAKVTEKIKQRNSTMAVRYSIEDVGRGKGKTKMIKPIALVPRK